MKNIIDNIQIKINDKIFIKNPESSDLGKNIISNSIDLINEIGFDAFTFKKLSDKISSSEASVYRYFESKHHLLVYLTAWYWSWMEYRIVIKTLNIECPEKRLEICMDILTGITLEDINFSFINEEKLEKIVTNESSKIYLNKEVDIENKNGFFMPYKNFVERISQIILEINPKYKYPHMLVSTIIEGIHHQRFYRDHLPRLTDVVKGEDSINNFYKKMIFTLIK